LASHASLAQAISDYNANPAVMRSSVSLHSYLKSLPDSPTVLKEELKKMGELMVQQVYH
jgi:hypothetical protein